MSPAAIDVVVEDFLGGRLGGWGRTGSRFNNGLPGEWEGLGEEVGFEFSGRPSRLKGQ